MSLLIRKEGIFTTVQDLGKYGRQRFGINPMGSMDRTATRLINLILGNDDANSVIEMHFPASEIVFEEACMFALGGADFHASLDGESVEIWRCLRSEKASILKFEQKVRGNRCYLAVAGGFKIAPSNDSEFGDRRLRKSDRLDYAESKNTVAGLRVADSVLPIYSSFPTVRVIAGGEFDLLSVTDQQALVEENFAITNDSNRMGFRLKGPAFSPNKIAEMVSAAVSFGTIQLLPDGQLIVLMADHQTSGGYPRIANVISVDLPLLAQLGPSDKVAFKLIDIAEAERVSTQFERDLQLLQIGCRFGRYW
ncbi:MAG: biotin-dependent carboxyltransferase family protein [Pyrinomonadaceae bacterium]